MRTVFQKKPEELAVLVGIDNFMFSGSKRWEKYFSDVVLITFASLLTPGLSVAPGANADTANLLVERSYMARVKLFER